MPSAVTTATDALIASDPGALAACDEAARILRSLGFRHAGTSRISEACYYALDGWNGTIRVAAHRLGRNEALGLTMPVAATITFGSGQGWNGDQDRQIGTMVRKALGDYLFCRLQALNGSPDAVWECRSSRKNGHPGRCQPKLHAPGGSR